MFFLNFFGDAVHGNRVVSFESVVRRLYFTYLIVRFFSKIIFHIKEKPCEISGCVCVYVCVSRCLNFSETETTTADDNTPYIRATNYPSVFEYLCTRLGL